MTEVTDDGANRVRELTQEGELIHFAGKKANSAHICSVEMCSDVKASNCSCALPSLTLTSAANEFEVRIKNNDIFYPFFSLIGSL